MLEQAKHTLKTYFGYSSFRIGQEDIISRVLGHQDTLGILPTGGGKSLCYQIPALLVDGLTIVISPLISLMKDQVDQLQQLGIPATFINSSLDAIEMDERISGIRNGDYKLIYIAPERLEAQGFRNMLKTLPISIIAVDEAHCISQWGHDFRPSYRYIYKICDLPEKPTVIALTATATPNVIADIQELLHIDDQNTIVTGFKRENLTFSVMKGQDKRRFIQSYVKEHSTQSGIIYAATRKEVDQLHEFLQQNGVKAGKYHAGLGEQQREDMQNQFLYDQVTIMVATNAFGMGIDKSNVRFVIHYNLPRTMESYYQEAGRAGRDGEHSECILLFTPYDIQIQKFLIEQSLMDETAKKAEYEKLQKMTDYCHTELCLQRYIVEYFGDTYDQEQCGKCQNCTDNRETVDITTEAQMIFSCIRRMNERFGKTIVAQVLKGSKGKRIIELGLNHLPTYGLLKHKTEKDIASVIDFLIAEGYCKLTNSQYPVVMLTPNVIPVLKGELKVFKKEQVVTKHIQEDNALFEVLRNLRKEIADREGIPPYIVFSDSTLRDMCEKCPTDETSMLTVKGVAQTKFERYGVDFLKTIQQYLNENGQTITTNVVSSSTSSPVKSDEKPSYFQTYELFQAGMDIANIAEERGLSRSTVESHLLRAIEEGLTINIERLINPEHEKLIIEKAKELKLTKLKELKNALPEEFDYFEIRLVLQNSF
ncbi:DNA helicase RecQ [Bacillus sp. Marseille-P3661]|uniref:DNA helicase RecQ n=1 Tax=Bacillus sp. Marseille-P3661 TaxID=1936234 RepID=UPI000C825256|nr:DNA helicase RecQ [Bacillus sp. Marseille-P3661]